MTPPDPIGSFLFDNLSDPTSRFVFEDWLAERGRSLRGVSVAIWLSDDDADDDDAAADAAADADAAVADADAAYAANANADADAADDDDDDDAAADDDDDAWHKTISFLLEEPDMREGLKLVQTPGRYWGVTQIGRLVHVRGDEYDLREARTIVRTGPMVSLRDLAMNGLGKHHRLSDAVPGSIEELNRIVSFRRCLVANVDAWLEHFPEAKKWETEALAAREA